MKRTNTVNAPRALDIKGQPHQLSYITPQEAEVLKALGGSGKPGPMGIPSYFGDDFADFEGGGADARGGGENYDSSPTGSQGPSDSGDDGGEYNPGFDYAAQARAQRQAEQLAAQRAAEQKAERDKAFAREIALEQATIGFSDPMGGTTISGNQIQGGKIYGFSPSDIAREQRFSNLGSPDPMTAEPSIAFANAKRQFEAATGITEKNPFGRRGVFDSVFGVDDVDYTGTMSESDRKKTYDTAFDRFLNFEEQPDYAQKRGFGSLVGTPEGEMTAQGMVKKQVEPMSTGEIAGRLAASAAGIGLPVSLLPGGNVSYVPQASTNYDRNKDPDINPDLKETLAEEMIDFVTGGAGTQAYQQGKEKLQSGIKTLSEKVKDFFTPDDEDIIRRNISSPTSSDDGQPFDPNTTTITSGAASDSEIETTTTDEEPEDKEVNLNLPEFEPFSFTGMGRIGQQTGYDDALEQALSFANNQAMYDDRMFYRNLFK